MTKNDFVLQNGNCIMSCLQKLLITSNNNNANNPTNISQVSQGKDSLKAMTSFFMLDHFSVISFVYYNRTLHTLLRVKVDICFSPFLSVTLVNLKTASWGRLSSISCELWLLYCWDFNYARDPGAHQTPNHLCKI